MFLIIAIFYNPGYPLREPKQTLWKSAESLFEACGPDEGMCLLQENQLH